MDNKKIKQYCTEYGDTAIKICDLAEGMPEEAFNAMVAVLIIEHAKESGRDEETIITEVTRILITHRAVIAAGLKEEMLKKVQKIVNGDMDE